MGGKRSEEMWQQVHTQSQNQYPMDIKDLEADQDRGGVMT